MTPDLATLHAGVSESREVQIRVMGLAVAGRVFDVIAMAAVRWWWVMAMAMARDWRQAHPSDQPPLKPESGFTFSQKGPCITPRMRRLTLVCSAKVSTVHRI